MAFARAGGITTVLVLGGFIFVMLRKERRQSESRGSDERRPLDNTSEDKTPETDQ
jgi:hypothetical protein